jgi:hypothetical protein
MSFKRARAHNFDWIYHVLFDKSSGPSRCWGDLVLVRASMADCLAG